MKRMIIKRVYTLLFIMFFFAAPQIWAGGSHEKAVHSLLPNDELPTDTRVHAGTLENGMRYFVMKNTEPPQYVSLRLMVHTGSIFETDTQRGLAHFVEHMAFNGTKSYAENEIDKFLQSIGLSVGTHANAFTGFDETVYIMDVPIDDKENLPAVMHLLKEMVSEMTLADEAIDRERGVVEAEWRRGLSGDTRVFHQQMKVLAQDSLYAERLPIGDIETIRNAPYSEFHAFYQRWYRPDNMTVIAVGDMSPQKLKRLIKQHFGDIPQPQTALQRPHYTIPHHPDLRTSIVSDPEVSENRVFILIRQKHRKKNTTAGYRTYWMEKLTTFILSERLDRIARDPEAPIWQPYVYAAQFTNDFPLLSINTTVRNTSSITETFASLVRELERFHIHGILENELDRARNTFLTQLEQELENKNAIPSQSFAGSLLDYALTKQPVLDSSFAYSFVQDLFDNLTIQTVNQVIKEMFHKENILVFASTKEPSEDNIIPTEEELLAVRNRVKQETILPLEVTDIPDDILAQEPQTGDIVEERAQKEAETIQLILSNGMNVVLKPTKFQTEELVFLVYSNKGGALFSENRIPAVRLVTATLAENGIGKLDAIALKHKLLESTVNIQPFLQPAETGIYGVTSPADTSILFQLIHALFVHPSIETAALENARQGFLQRIQKESIDPYAQFTKRITELVYPDNVYHQSLSKEQIEAVTREQVEAIQADMYANPADFTVFIIGHKDSVNTQDIRMLTKQYLASIPTRPFSQQMLTAVPQKAHWKPTGAVSDTLPAAIDPISQVSIDFATPIREPVSWKTVYMAERLGDLLNQRLSEIIREERGESYAVHAHIRIEQLPPRVAATITMDVAPERAEALAKDVIHIVRDLQEKPAEDEEVQRIQAQWNSQYKEMIRSPHAWAYLFSLNTDYQLDISELLDLPTENEALTAEKLQQFAQQYLHSQDRVQVILLPVE